MLEYIIIGLIVLTAAVFLFRYFRKTARDGVCSDCAKHCCHEDREICEQNTTSTEKRQKTKEPFFR